MTFYNRSKDDLHLNENSYFKIIADLQEKYEDSIEDKYDLVYENELNVVKYENEINEIKKENRQLKYLNIFISGCYFAIFYYLHYKKQSCELDFVET